MLPDPAGQNPGTLNQVNALLSSLDSPFPHGSGTATLASRISSQKSHREWKAEKKRVELESPDIAEVLATLHGLFHGCCSSKEQISKFTLWKFIKYSLLRYPAVSVFS